MELFDKKFVYFMWEDELEGKEVFTEDDMESLIKAVNNNNSRHKVSHTVDNSNLGKEASYDLKVPFRNKDTCVVHQFAYYDPNYDCKCAYAEGKQIQYELDGEWFDLGKLEPNWKSNFNFRIKPEEPKSRRMTYRELAEWLAKENGQYTPLLSKTYVSSAMDYDNTLDDNELPEGYVVRRWGSDEWIEPTVDVYAADCKKE